MQKIQEFQQDMWFKMTKLEDDTYGKIGLEHQKTIDGIWRSTKRLHPDMESLDGTMTKLSKSFRDTSHQVIKSSKLTKEWRDSANN